MIGFNGGLIGAVRDTSAAQSVPGIWTPGEQVVARGRRLWPTLDPLFNKVTLLHDFGRAGVSDLSIIDHGVTVFGNAAISQAQSIDGGQSLYLDGSGDYLGYSSNRWGLLGADPFTVECWVRLDSIGSRSPMVLDARGSTSGVPWALFVNTNGTVAFRRPGGVLNGTIAISANQWTHIAVTRSGNTYTIYTGGVANGTVTVSGLCNGGATVYLGRPFDSPTINAFNGYIDKVRITQGTGAARYTADFDPPTFYYY